MFADWSSRLEERSIAAQQVFKARIRKLDSVRHPIALRVDAVLHERVVAVNVPPRALIRESQVHQ